jgi:hypothetical protein
MSHGSSNSSRPARSLSKLMALLTAGTLACSLSGAAQQMLATVTPGGAAAQTTGSVKANATSPVSVELSWEPVAGASRYTIELAVAGQESLTVAQLSGNETSYEDFPAPPATELTYRVQAATSGGSVAIGSAILTTPAETPDPLVVNVSYEQNTFTIPTYDPNHPYVDPSTFLPEGFDPENPDLSLLQPGPKVHTQEIGPQGGTMEVTAANGVKYTLTVPPGAVPFSMLFGLTPVTSMDGSPLSGGLMGAVRIEPEGIEFSQPLVLEVTPAADAPALPEGTVAVGFAVTPQNEGSEYSFLPSQAQPVGSLGPRPGGRLASLVSGPLAAGPLGGMRLKVVDGRVVGVDSGPASEVRNTVKNHPPSNSKDRTNSKIAAEQVEEELAPVPVRDREGAAIERKAAEAGSTDQFLEVLTDFQAYLDAGKTAHAEAIWDEILVNTKAMFELEKMRCFTQDGFRAAGVAARMSFDDSPFWSQFAARYVKKYGEKSLDDARAFAQRCKLSLKVDSHITYVIAAVSITYDATIDIKPLLMSYESDRQSPKYGPYLKGYALVYPTRIEFKDSQCQEVTLKPFPTAFIRIGLKPVFDGEGNVLHFSVVDFGGGGERETLTQKCDDSTNTALIANPSGGTWGGLFVDARHGQVFFDLAPLSSPPPSSGEIARMRFRQTAEPGLSGALFTEDTTFKVVLGD